MNILKFTSSFYIFMSLIVLSPNLFASRGGKELIDNYDLRSYHPEQYGLKDLVFEARISNLMEILKKSLAVEKLEDVYFKVYWIMPGKYEIEVIGLPKGFVQIKEQLKSILKARMDYVIPKKLAPLVRSYRLKTLKNGNNNLVKALDDTNTKNINEMHLLFSKNGQLDSLKTFSPSGVKMANMKFSAKSWSHNKWLLDKVDVETILGIQKTTISSEIKYTSVSGFGFPSTVEITTTQEIVGTQNIKGKGTSRKIQSSLNFSKFAVNTGKAYELIMRKMNNKAK